MDEKTVVKRARVEVVLGWVTSWEVLGQGVTKGFKAKHQSEVRGNGLHCLVEYWCEDDDDVMS